MGSSTFTARGQSDRRTLPGMLALLALLMGVVGLIVPSSPAGAVGPGETVAGPPSDKGVQPELLKETQGQTCGDFNENWFELGKIDEQDLAEGASVTDDGLTFTILNLEPESATFDWEANFEPAAVFVAGGTDVSDPGSGQVGNLYDYEDATEVPPLLEGDGQYRDGSLHAPGRLVDDNFVPFAVSHISVCLQLVQPSPTGDITLTKVATGDVPTGATFTFEVDCDDDDFDATGITLSDGDDPKTVVDDAPAGTECTIEETGKAGADTTSFTVDGGEPVVADSVTVIVDGTTTVAVVATNDFEEEQPTLTGDVTLEKVATGDVPTGATFTFSVNCDGTDFDATGITLSDGDDPKTVVDDAPAGTECTIEETGKAGADTTSFTVDGGEPVVADSVTVIVDGTTTVAVLATNDFEESVVVTPATFELNLLKIEEGDPSNLLSGAQFALFADVGTTTGVLDDGDDFIENCTTDGDGECEFDELEAGDYLLVETQAPAGFVAESDEPIGVTIVDADENVTVENQPVAVGGIVFERPDIALDKVADPVIANVGETVTYTYRITNTGDTTLSDLVLVDDKLGVILLTGVVLEPGESTEVQETYVVTQADAEAGEIVNVAVVTGDSPTGETVTARDTAEVAVVDVAGVVVTRPAPDAEEAQPAPEAEAEGLARTGASSGWLLMVAMFALIAGTAFLRAADRREGGVA